MNPTLYYKLTATELDNLCKIQWPECESNCAATFEINDLQGLCVEVPVSGDEPLGEERLLLDAFIQEGVDDWGIHRIAMNSLCREKILKAGSYLIVQ